MFVHEKFVHSSQAVYFKSQNSKDALLPFGVCLVAVDTNKITSIPSEIGLLKNLEEFILSDNEITSIPTEIGSPGMSMRDLDFSKFSSFELDMSMVVVIEQGDCLVERNVLILVLVCFVFTR